MSIITTVINRAFTSLQSQNLKIIRRDGMQAPVKAYKKAPF